MSSVSPKKGINLKQLNSKNKHLFDESRLIVDVWSHNLSMELAKIMNILDDYPNIAMDTEFPGVVARPIGCFKNSGDYKYQTLKCNVDLLKIIQLGLTFCDDEGNLPPGTSTWQFNFKFNLQEDMYAQDSIDLLLESGIKFNNNRENGIDVSDFAEQLMVSGIVLNDDIKWISFHSSYDYGYLLKVLTCQALPKEESDFFDLLKTYFPCLYDIKYLMISCDNLRGGLQKVAEEIGLERIGPQHQAGSDSLLTASIFYEIKNLYFENNIDDEKFSGKLYGIGKDLTFLKDKDKKRKKNGVVGAANEHDDRSSSYTTM